MKKTLLLAALALALAFTSGAGAQMMGSDIMQGDEQQATQPPQDMPDMMYPGMMGGCGMGCGMMGGYGMGPGMMGNYGSGMEPGMMHQCRKHKHGNWSGYGFGRSQEDQKKFSKFLDDTRELRKKLLLLRFDYGELLRNPASTMKERFDMEKEMLDLQQKIREKAGE